MPLPVSIPSPQTVAAPARAVGDDPVRAIGLVLLAMVSFACSDATAKHLSATLPALEIVWLRWVGFGLIMAPYVAWRRGAVLRSAAPGLQVLRTFGLLGSASLFIAGLHVLPLASNAAIAFVAPLCVTALSIPLLGETVGIRRWAAVIAGLLGVLIVIRPGSGTYGAAAILPLLSAVSWAFGMIMTRKISQADGAGTTMTWSAYVGLAALSVAVPFAWVAPGPQEVALAALMAIASTAAQLMIVIAYRMAKVSVLAPISYSQLIWSSLLGIVAFGTWPDAWTLLGSAVIVGSGLYTAHRERVTARMARA